MLEFTKAIQLVGKPIEIKTSDATMAQFIPVIVKVVSVEAVQYQGGYKKECFMYYTELDGTGQKADLDVVTVKE